MNIIGRKIRLLRHQKGWTQEDVAVRLGISIPAFSKLEAGISDINLSRLEKIADLFDLSVIQILTLDDHADQKFTEEMQIMTKLLNERGAELMDLQRKVIELYEQLRMKAVC